MAVAHADSINSFTITEATLKALPHCLHYKIPTHFCLWISDMGEVNPTPILDHYLPDLVVTVYRRPDENPWTEVANILDKTAEVAEQTIVKTETGIDVGYGNHSADNSQEQHVTFKEADVLGNPALAVVPQFAGFVLLPSSATVMKPYFHSMLDSTLWRGLPPYALAEQTTALGLSATHHIGKFPTNWGSIYPHEGKVIGDNDAKVSAVIASRAADILTNSLMVSHVHQRLSTKCGEKCKAASIQENNEETMFQMVYPITQDDCEMLGSAGSYTSSMLNKEGAYVWVVWRHYTGCADGDGNYIGRT